MKLTRKNAMRATKILRDKGNVSVAMSNSICESEDSFIKAEADKSSKAAQPAYKLRSSSNVKATKRSLEINQFQTPPKKKRQSIQKISPKSSIKDQTPNSLSKNSTSKKLTRIRSALNVDHNTPHVHTGRYLLRSHSVQKKNEIISPTLKVTSSIEFRTPKPPKKPLSELRKKATPIKIEQDDLNSSQLSDYSSCSAISTTLLSRFIKQKSKLKKSEPGKNWKHMRKIELSQDSLETASIASIEDVMINRLQKLALNWYMYFNIFTSHFKTEAKNRLVYLFQSLSSTSDPTQKILNLCNQSEIVSWKEFLDDPSNETVKKIGEGVYGEVFRLIGGSNVLKLFPVNGSMLVNGEDQMTMEDVFPELFVSRKLTELNQSTGSFIAPNYAQLKKAKLLTGKLPAIFINQWKDYESEKGTENELLDFLPSHQNWMVLEYKFAGEPLPEYKFSSRSQVRCVIEQVALSLAVAETSLMFEHRDLHWQNILVKETDMDEISYKLQDTEYTATCDGLFVTIIDFTVSRMCVESNTVYMDMSDCPEIFEGEGDYQFEIYRMMKNDNNNDWRKFNPRSNLYWLHYLIDKLINDILYPRGDPEGRAKEFELRQLYRRILDYNSAKELIEKDPYFESCHTHDLNLSKKYCRSTKVVDVNKENVPEVTDSSVTSSESQSSSEESDEYH